MPHLGAELIDLNPVGAHPPVHDVLPMRQLHVPFLQTYVRGVVSLNDLVQRDRKLLPAVFRILPQLLDGREDDHGIFRGGIDVDHLTRCGPL